MKMAASAYAKAPPSRGWMKKKILEQLLRASEVKKDDMSEPLLSPEEEKNDMLEPQLSPEEEKNDMSEPLLSPEEEKNDMSEPLYEISDAEHGSPTLVRNEDDYHMKQMREGYTEIETMIETGCDPGNPAEDEKKHGERMAIRVTNIANIVLFALKVSASIESKSLSIIASILDPFFDLLWEFILWLTSHAMQNPNPHKYPIGKERMQPVGMIVFGSFGLQLLFLAAKQFITKSKPEKDPQKEKWMIGVMTFVTMVQFMLAFYCQRFENKIVRTYAEHHSSNVITNLISLAAAVLAIRYYWWIDPTGAMIILLFTMYSWTKMFFENLFALIGRTAPPKILENIKCLISNHHENIMQTGRVRAYTFCCDQYFVEVHIVLPQDMVLSKAHDIGETLQVKLEQLDEIKMAFVHLDYKPEHMV
ncbi:hypothetical protein ACJW30_11G013000 [Castanea mollissima]